MALNLEMAQRIAEQDPQGAVRQLNQTQAMIAEASEQMHPPSVFGHLCWTVLGVVTALQARAKGRRNLAGRK